MTLDSVYNFVTLLVSGPYDQNATSIVIVAPGYTLPATPFNCTYWNSTDYPNPADDPNVEIVRVTNISGNTLTITRGAESATGGGVASTKNTNSKVYKLILGITAKMITDIGNNLQKPWQRVNVSGTIDGSNTHFTITPAPFDTNSVQLKLARQPQEQGIDYTIDSSGDITYVVPPDPSLNGMPHTAVYQ